MKNNVIFTTIGALLMLIGLKTLDAISGKTDTIQHYSAVSEQAPNLNSLTSDVVIEKRAGMNQKQAQNPESIAVIAPQMECPPIAEFTDEQAFAKIASSMFNNPEYNEQIVQMGLRSLTQQLKKIPSIDPIRLKQIQSFAKQKIDDDLIAFNRIYGDPGFFSGLGVFDDLNNSSEDQPNKSLNKQKEADFEKKVEQALIKQEQSRVVYEDKLRNVLSYEELQQYQENETKLVQSSALSDINYTSRMLKKEITSLSPQQISDINHLVSDAQQHALKPVPIGSSISEEESMIGLDSVDNFETKITIKMMDLLTPEQLEQFENGSLQFDSLEDLSGYE